MKKLNFQKYAPYKEVIMKKTLAFLFASVVLASCGGYNSIGLSDDGTGEACRYDIQKALDQGNYDFVIQRLTEDITCSGGMTAEEGNMNLAAAYVGKAGFTIPVLINDILKSQIDSNINNLKNYDFNQFLEVLSTKAKVSNITHLERASRNYRNIVSNCGVPNLTDIQKDACFYRGLVEAAKSSISLAFTLGNIESWLNPGTCDDLNNNKVGDNGEIEACALEYAVNNTCNISAVGGNFQTFGNVTFSDGITYESIKVTIPSNNPSCSNNEEYKLIFRSNTLKSVVMTEGYCDVNYNQCQNPDGVTCLPCPVLDVNGNPYTIEGTILDTIESAANLISDTVGNTNSDVQQAIDDFKNEVCTADDNDPTTCTSLDLAEYIKNQ